MSIGSQNKIAIKKMIQLTALGSDKGVRYCNKE